MIEYFMGKFLVQEGIISKNKFEELFDKQRESALCEIDNKKSLEDNKIAFIQLIQNTIDEKLSNLASEYDVFNDDERKKNLIKKRQNLNINFFIRLINEGILSSDGLSQELEKMRTYYALNMPGVSRNLKETFEIILSGFIKAGDYYANEYAMILLKYILRFVNPNLTTQKSIQVKEYFAERIAVGKVVTSNERYFIAIGADKKTLQDFNDNISSGFKAARGEGRYASLCAFLNCIANIFQCLIAREKDVVYLDLSNVYKYSTITVSENCRLLPISVTDMNLDILIGYGEKPNFAMISHNV